MTSSLDQLYQQVILDHARERHGEGLRENDAPTGENRQFNPLCGDDVTVRVSVVHDQGGNARIGEVSWEGHGCSISQASTSVMHELTVGATVPHAHHLAEEFRTMIRSRGKAEADEELLGDAVAFAGVGKHANRVKCAMLGWAAFEAALQLALKPGSTDE